VLSMLFTLSFMVSVTITKPFFLEFSDSLKIAVDSSVLITLQLSLALKLNLNGEELDRNILAWIILSANLLLPLFVILWHIPWTSSGNASSQIDDEEREKIDHIFDILDKDNSGSLTRDELQAFVMATCGGLTYDRHGTLQTQIEQTLDQLDAGANGTISHSEWRKYVKKMYSSHAERAALFQIVDDHVQMTLSNAKAQHKRTARKHEKEREAKEKAESKWWKPKPKTPKKAAKPTKNSVPVKHVLGKGGATPVETDATSTTKQIRAEKKTVKTNKKASKETKAEVNRVRTMHNPMFDSDEDDGQVI